MTNESNESNKPNKSNESNTSLKLVLGIVIPFAIIILVIIGFLLYKKYNKSKDEKIVNNIKEMGSMKKEPLLSTY